MRDPASVVLIELNVFEFFFTLFKRVLRGHVVESKRTIRSSTPIFSRVNITFAGLASNYSRLFLP